MPVARELIRALAVGFKELRAKDVVYEKFEQIGVMDTLKQFLLELEGEDPSAVIIRHTFNIFPYNIFAVHWQFWPKDGCEGAYQLPPSQRGKVPSLFTSKGVGIEVNPDEPTHVRFTNSPTGWNYLRTSWHPLIVSREEFLPSLRLAREMAEPADDYRCGRGDKGLKAILSRDKSWQILKF